MRFEHFPYWQNAIYRYSIMYRFSFFECGGWFKIRWGEPHRIWMVSGSVSIRIWTSIDCAGMVIPWCSKPILLECRHVKRKKNVPTGAACCPLTGSTASVCVLERSEMCSVLTCEPRLRNYILCAMFLEKTFWISDIVLRARYFLPIEIQVCIRYFSESEFAEWNCDTNLSVSSGQRERSTQTTA